jgi:cell division protein FtsL
VINARLYGLLRKNRIEKASRRDKIMNFWLISILLILSAYIFSLIYLNTKVRRNEKKPSDIPPVESKEDQIPDNLRPLKASISLMGGLVLGILILMMLSFAIGVIFFRDEFLPR